MRWLKGLWRRRKKPVVYNDPAVVYNDPKVAYNGARL